MNKAELIKAVAAKAGCTEKEAANCVNATLETITESIKKKEDVALVGFGTFKTSHRAERTSRNPRTGESVKIPAKTVPTFSAGKALKDAAL